MVQFEVAMWHRRTTEANDLQVVLIRAVVPTGLFLRSRLGEEKGGQGGAAPEVPQVGTSELETMVSEVLGDQGGDEVASRRV